MATLREIIDGTTISAAAPKASKPSPIAQHVSEHMQDPVGRTKDNFGKLTQAKLEYDMAREEAQRNLAPVQSVLDHVSQMHNLDPRSGAGTPGMMPNQMSPDNTGVPGVPGAGGDEQYDEDGNPINMQQTVGKMNQSRPSQVGHQPGVAPGDGQTVRPPKMGMATPGSPTAQNSPQPGGKGQFGPTAAKPKGAGQLPGAKGPGDPKVANRTKKAQNGGSGKAVGKGGGVNVTVHASVPGVLTGSRNNLSSASGLGMLRTMSAGPEALRDKSTEPGNQVAYNPKFNAKGMKKCEACGQMHAAGKCMKGGGPGSGRHPEGRSKVQYGPSRNAMIGRAKSILKKANALGETKVANAASRVLAHLQSGKPIGMQHAVFDSHLDKIYDKASRDDNKAVRYDTLHDRMYRFDNSVINHVTSPKTDSIKGAGTSKGAKHRLSTKGQKHLSKKEKVAHWQTMDAGGPGSGRRPGTGSNAKYSGGRLMSDNRPMSGLAHKHLSGNGFKFKGTSYDGEGRSEGISMYSHPKHGSVDVYQGGQWNHSAKSGYGGEGYSATELKSHLASLK